MLKFRLASMRDAAQLLEWRNDPDARRYFFNPHRVAVGEHESWLKSFLMNPAGILFIIESEEGQPIGQLRFDIRGPEAEISITISKIFRGMGYGADAVQHGSEYCFQMRHSIQKIIARCKEDNLASIKVFIKAGYQEIEKKQGVVILLFARPRMKA